MAAFVRVLFIALVVCLARAEFEPQQRFVAGGGRYRGKQFRVTKGGAGVGGSSTTRPVGWGGRSRARVIGAPVGQPYPRTYIYRSHSPYYYRSRGTRQSPSTGTETATDWIFSTKGVPSIRAKFFNDKNDAKSSFEFSVVLLKFIEFEDSFSITGPAVSSRGYDVEDKLGRVLSLVTPAWTDVVEEEETIMLQTVRKSSASLATEGAKVTITVRQAPQRVDYNGADIAPNAMKFDVDLVNFPYTPGFGAAGKEVKLGLAMLIQSAPTQTRHRKARSARTTDGEIAVGNDNGDGFGRFVWKLTAQTWSTSGEGGLSDILTSPLLPDPKADADVAYLRSQTAANGDSNPPDVPESTDMVVFTFDAVTPQRILWDPSVALDDELLEGGGGAVRANGLAVLCTSLVALLTTHLL